MATNVLEGPHPQMACGDAREDGAGQDSLAADRLAGGHDGQGAGRRDAERVHRLADEVLAEHRADCRPTVAPARERRTPRALEVDVAPAPVDVKDLAEEQRPPVAEPRRPAAELVAGVALGDGRQPVGDTRPEKQGDAVAAVQRVGFSAELGGEPVVEHEHLGRAGRGRRPRLVQALEVADVRRLRERQKRAGSDGHPPSIGAAGAGPEATATPGDALAVRLQGVAPRISGRGTDDPPSLHLLVLGPITAPPPVSSETPLEGRFGAPLGDGPSLSVSLRGAAPTSPRLQLPDRQAGSAAPRRRQTNSS